MIRYLKILLLIFFILSCYVSIIKIFPGIGIKIDSVIGANFNSMLISNADKIIKNIGGIRGNTDSLIDGVGTNSKNRSREFQDNLNDMRNAN